MFCNFKFKFHYLFYLIPASAMAYLFWENSKPALELNCDFKKKTALCGELVPVSRVAAGDGGAEIKEEPVYFDARIPRKYDRVEAEIIYSDLRHDLLEFGISRDESRRAFDFAPLQNKILDNLLWQKIEGEGLVLYQKKSVYKNISELKKKMPGAGETLIYRANAAPPLGALNAKGETVIDFPVKESLRLLVYKSSGEPEIKILSSVIPTPPSVIPAPSPVIPAEAGIQSNNNEIPYQVRNDKIGDNLYKVEIKGAADAVFTKITINSPYVAIADKIKIGRLEKPLTLYFAGSRLFANAYAAGGAQKIDANGQIINIEKIKEQYVYIFKNIKLRPVEIPEGEVELGGTLFFINNKNIFYPRYEPFYAGADLSKINFIITQYKPPIVVIASESDSSEERGDPANSEIASSAITSSRNDRLSRVGFDIKDTPAPGGKLRFIISLPNAAPPCHSPTPDRSRGQDCSENLVTIESIKLKFTGGKFSIFDIWNKFF